MHKVVRQQQSIPQVLVISQFSGIAPDIFTQISQIVDRQTGWTSRMVSIQQTGEAFRSEPLNPIFNRSWRVSIQASRVTGTGSIQNMQNGMEPMDIGGRVNPGLFAAFLHYLDLARPFGFKFLLVLHEDYTKPCYFNRGALERWCLPWFAGEPLDALPAFKRRFIRDGELIDTIAAK